MQAGAGEKTGGIIKVCGIGESWNMCFVKYAFIM